MSERFFITGASGCIGAWVVYLLVKEKVPVCALIHSDNLQRLQLILKGAELSHIEFCQGDITDLSFLEKAMKNFGTTHVIHLAALQLPFCKDDPPKGSLVNILGTINVFEAVKRAGLNHIVYASSMAVYGSNDEYPVGPLSHNALLKPKSHYGVFKQANEGNAKIYWMEDRISSIGLRPHVVYGPGRDQGMTSAPTKAILAAVLHKPFHIPFGGRFCFNYAEDTARLFIQASRVLFEGSEVFNIGGKSISMQEIIHAIEIECPASKGLLTFDNIRLPFPEEVDNIEMRRVLGLYHEISLQEGIAKTVQIFKETLKTGLLKEEKFS